MSDFTPFLARMRADGQPELAIAVFRHYFEALTLGATGLMPESELEPVALLPDLAELGHFAPRGERELDRLAVVKLNGGLGTSMGMERAKSLLPVKGGKRFIDLIADQLVHLRKTLSARLPLVLMDSFRTQRDTLDALDGHPVLDQDVPSSFLQHRVPKVVASDLSPACHTDDDLNWCPPGHGDLYPALATSGLLDELLANGFTHAFVSNADNLGAIPSPALLGWMLERDLPFVMECADRTAADKKGGHLARKLGGGLVLREVAQCPDGDLDAFQDTYRHRYFNSNNLWVDLRSVRRLIDEIQKNQGALGLPLIRNKKPLDPTNPTGDGATVIYQLETAMGSAIALFEGADAVRVGRDRFMPVKTTNDLLLMASDVYAVTGGGQLTAIVATLPSVDLDPRFFKTIQDFEARITAPLSLVSARSLTVRGDVRFGSGVVIKGDVVIDHAGPEPLVLSDVTLEG